MKRNAVLTLLIVLLAILSCTTITKEQNVNSPTLVERDSVQRIDRGRYLITIGGCNDCHSPKVMGPEGPMEDSKRLLSGYDGSRPFEGFDKQVARSGSMVIFNIESTAFAGPWGVSYAANLTPHKTGLGGWDLKRFARAMKNGKWRGLESTRSLLPPMPWQNYREIADEDLEAMFAYLQSLTPIDNPIPVPVFLNKWQRAAPHPSKKHDTPW